MTDRTDTTSRRADTAAGALLYLLLGPILWAGHLTAIYGTQSVLCAKAAADAVPAIIAVVTALALALIAVAVLAPSRTARLFAGSAWSESTQRFMRNAMVTLALLSAFGIAAQGAIALFIPTCPALR